MNAQAPPNDFREWVPIHGGWEKRAVDATYRGLEGQDRDPGVLLAPPRDRALTRGRLATTVRLEPDDMQAQARIVVAREPGSRRYISAGIGGHDACYVIEAWEPEHGHQRPLALVERPPAAWEPSIPIAVHVEGPRLALRVGGVEVAYAQMPRPLLPGDQLGLFAWTERGVTFEGFESRREEPHAFVAMPFKDFDHVFEKIVRPVGELAEIVLGDARSGPGSITSQIERQIRDADVVIAEVTATNPNVFFEVGFAMALSKPVILVAKRKRRLPFDVQSYRCVYYDPTPEGMTRAAADLALEVKAALARGPLVG